MSSMVHFDNTSFSRCHYHIKVACHTFCQLDHCQLTKRLSKFIQIFQRISFRCFIWQYKKWNSAFYIKICHRRPNERVYKFNFLVSKQYMRQSPKTGNFFPINQMLFNLINMTSLKPFLFLSFFFFRIFFPFRAALCRPLLELSKGAFLLTNIVDMIVSIFVKNFTSQFQLTALYRQFLSPFGDSNEYNNHPC